MTDNISHSITTSTNGGPKSCYNTRLQSWYKTRSSPQLEIHSHRVPSMRIIELIQHKSRFDTTQVHSLDTTQDQSWYNRRPWIDTTQVHRMTPDVVQSTTLTCLISKPLKAYQMKRSITSWWGCGSVIKNSTCCNCKGVEGMMHMHMRKCM